MLHLQNSEGTVLLPFEAHAIVSNPEPKIADHPQALNVSFACVAVMRQSVQDLQCLLAIHPP